MRRALSMVAVVTALAVGGCGGDDGGDSGGGGEKAPTKAEFVKQANAICAAGTKEINDAATKAFADGNPTEEQVTQFAVDTAIPSVEGQIEDLEALTPPKGEEAAFQKVLEAARGDLSAVKADPKRMANAKAFENANKAATDYGIAKCAE